MTTVKQNIQSGSILTEEVQQLRKTAKRIAMSKESARRFLISTGAYTSTGKLKPEFR